MNILREVRRVSKKSMPVRLLSLLVFSLMLIISTFAWFAADKDLELTGLKGEVTSWDVAYYVNEDSNEILDQTAVFVIDEFYPGMPTRAEDVVHIYNVGESSTRIEYEIISVKLFGIEILETLRTDGEIQTEGNTTNIFSKDTNYPFDVSYTYDREYLKGKYVDNATTPEAAASLRFNVDWEYGEAGRAEEISAKDILDTKFGQDSYEYYNDGNDVNTALEIKVRITSHMIHPSFEEGNS